MGFWENFKESYDKESEQYANDRTKSKYKTVKQREMEEARKYDYLYCLSDTKLLSKYNQILTNKEEKNEEEKNVIENILLDKGYIKAKDGTFHRI